MKTMGRWATIVEHDDKGTVTREVCRFWLRRSAARLAQQLDRAVNVENREQRRMFFGIKRI